MVSAPVPPVMVLLLDDDDYFRRALAEILRDDGHTVIDYANPTDVPAFAVLGPTSLLIVDYQMPNENGLSFADRFHEAYPMVPVLMITGSAEPSLSAAAALRSFLSVCSKPLEYAALEWLLPPRSAPH